MTRALFTPKKAAGALATAITGLTLAFGHPAAAAHTATAAHTTTAPAAIAMATTTATAPVAGLDQTQMNNAQHIVDAAHKMGLGERAQIIAVATAMQESKLYNLASTAIPDSYNYHHEGEGSDYDSVGALCPSSPGVPSQPCAGVGRMLRTGVTSSPPETRWGAAASARPPRACGERCPRSSPQCTMAGGDDISTTTLVPPLRRCRTSGESPSSMADASLLTSLECMN